ncbi:hypothetical protein CMV_030023 [Castanea mollissima]|uniref:Uncharacterized protein n=1 Tax=Castanea mollissima TaxID=60419 RepID=A0A8J4V6T7_9ROSI|nr:hypothetical protein CMV_030023 [Castanea mollissima]
MASQPRKGGVSMPESRVPMKNKPNVDSSIISKLRESTIVSMVSSRGREVATDAVLVTKKLMKSTGKAAWIAGTTILILAVPLLIVTDREQRLNELQLQEASLLGVPHPHP